MNMITITMTITMKTVSAGMPEQVSKLGLVSKMEVCDSFRLLCRKCLTPP